MAVTSPSAATSAATTAATSAATSAASSTKPATAINAGSTNKRVMWQGIGHGASIYSSCALPPVIEYLKSGELPSTDTYCPA